MSYTMTSYCIASFFWKVRITLDTVGLQILILCLAMGTEKGLQILYLQMLLLDRKIDASQKLYHAYFIR